jgi:hypothetical protein
MAVLELELVLVVLELVLVVLEPVLVVLEPVLLLVVVLLLVLGLQVLQMPPEELLVAFPELQYHPLHHHQEILNHLMLQRVPRRPQV